MPYRRPTRLAQTALIVGALALILSIGGNIATTIQAYRNCQHVELIKDRIRFVIDASLNDLKAGRHDAQFQRFYGSQWQKIKEESIRRQEIQLRQFQPDRCNFLIR